MIVLQGITKCYRTAAGRRYIFRDLNLTIPVGKSLGIIGHNGAGKSTLLRIIGGIDKPDCGKIIAHQKTISWPIGFKSWLQDGMTGRENAKFVCRLYTSETEIPKILAFVQFFAELGQYFDMPIHTYSTGMRARLAFALSMAFDFDYYLIDEVMAVGDAVFRRKCLALMKQKRKQANFVLASRNMSKIRKYCDLVLFLGQHETRLYQNVHEGIKAYRRERRIGQKAGDSGHEKKNVVPPRTASFSSTRISPQQWVVPAGGSAS